MEHTEQENNIIKEYQRAKDSEVQDFVDDVLSGKDRLNYITVAFLSEEAAKRIKTLTGKEVEGNRINQ